MSTDNELLEKLCIYGIVQVDPPHRKPLEHSKLAQNGESLVSRMPPQRTQACARFWRRKLPRRSGSCGGQQSAPSAAKKANARLQRLQEEAGAMPAAGEPEIDTPDEVRHVQSAFTTHSALSPLRAKFGCWHQPSAFVWRLCLQVGACDVQGPSQAAQGEDSRETDEELPEQNGMSPEDVSRTRGGR